LLADSPIIRPFARIAQGLRAVRMPIYSYRCEECGHAQDVLQKISATPLTVCPECGTSAFRKQVTAAGFHLKGSGWYVTDFRNPPAGKSGAKSASDKEGAGAESASTDAPPASANGGETKDKPAAPAAVETSSAGSDKAAAATPPAKSGGSAPSTST
jgi:putative FmdB family regulatory protein